jgi:hypothetical protein
MRVINEAADRTGKKLFCHAPKLREVARPPQQPPAIAMAIQLPCNGIAKQLLGAGWFSHRVGAHVSAADVRCAGQRV